MHLILGKEFRERLKRVIGSVPSNPKYPILSNVLLRVSQADQSYTITAFDLSVGVSLKGFCQTDASGAITLPAKLLNDVLNRMPDQVEMVVEGGSAVLKADGGEYAFACLPAEEFPELPTVDSESIELPIEILQAGFAAVGYTVSLDPTRQVLTGVHVKVTASKNNTVGFFEFAATDGHRLNTKKIEFDSSLSAEFTIPTKALKLITTAFEGSYLKLEFDSQILVARSASATVSTCLLEGQYPNYHQLIPRDFKLVVEFDRKTAQQVISRLMVLAENKNNIVKIEISAMAIRLSAESYGGNGAETIAAKVEGDPFFEFALNGRFLLELLKNFGHSEIAMKLNSPISPIVFGGVGDQDSIALVMPVQILGGVNAGC